MKDQTVNCFTEAQIRQITAMMKKCEECEMRDYKPRDRTSTEHEAKKKKLRRLRLVFDLSAACQWICLVALVAIWADMELLSVAGAIVCCIALSVTGALLIGLFIKSMHLFD